MPEMDEILESKMKPVTKTLESGEVVEDIRSVQLNEKVSDDTYQILHPETDAYQVITDPFRRFVSEEEKAKWNQAFELGASALHYRGLYVLGEVYKLYDVVYLEGPTNGETSDGYGDKGYGRRFFVYLNDQATIGKPDVKPLAPKYDEFFSNSWVNINFESYLAEFAQNVKINREDKDEYYTFAIFDSATNTYGQVSTAHDFYFNPVTKSIVLNNTIELDGSTGTVTAVKFIGDLEGNADTADRAKSAEEYVLYKRDAEGNLLDDQRVENGTKYIDDSIVDLNKRIDDITSGEGGAVLSKKFYVAKNGTDLNSGFDGREEQRVNITFTPKEIDDLLDNRDKIKEKWLPETILGAMNFIGTFDASTGALLIDLREPAGRAFRKGDYAIATVSGSLDPSGAAHSTTTAEGNYYLLGDWAVYVGPVDKDTDGEVEADEYWTKVDNTDAVRTVNSQIGDVKTYKGPWVGGSQYYAGDMVEYGNPVALYLCVKDNNDETFDEKVNFKIFGRIYKADDGIELTESDSTFRHKFKKAQTIESEAVVKLQPKSVITVSRVELEDIYGHTKVNYIDKYEMPDDTWRPVWVNGEQIQNETVTSGPLKLNHEQPDNENFDRRVTINVAYEGEGDTKPYSTIIHNRNLIGEGSHTSTILETNQLIDDKNKIGLGSQFTVPSFGWGNTGHVDSYEETIFELPEDLIQHKHFNVVLENGRSIIRSYTPEEYNLLDANERGRKFMDANSDGSWIVPTSTSRMAFNGEYAAKGLYQTSRSNAGTLHRAVDESATILHGTKYNGEEIIGTYNQGDNRFVQGDSGVHYQDNSVVYSAIAVNKKGIATAGGQILEFGTGAYDSEDNWISSDPSDSLVIGGLFFRNVGPKRDDNGQTA